MKMLKRLTFAGLIALSLLGSTSDAFAKESKHGRETAWTDLDDLLVPGGVTWELTPVIETTWEE